ncbi:inorganic phosphate transporter [Legionella maioricensis]|uniref:Inorganic phosphate transporter n=1 Tax=Legionella maioricensis TaxID=2896528 RepID=A0A9X2D214_9GAMM|nr:inorganic phosphate transporter [Legionella maioricensis]MCL9685074.1 inorganic phosphate transporter [Legionella maioricensis]MCL9688165.1 inorganic phosphate transporter [Legionella maioricensis]
MTEWWFVVFTIFVAFAFDFIDGFHDAANSIATIVTTRVLTPLQAVIWAALFNFISFIFFFKLAVAATVGQDIISPDFITTTVIFVALFSGIVWNLITWYFGIPSSSWHALIGGFIGAGFAVGGFSALVWVGIIKTVVSIFVSPVLGFFIGWALLFIFQKSLKRRKWNSQRLQKIFGRIQFISAAGLSIGHGGNNAQRTMGIVTALLYSAHMINGPFHVPLWVILLSNFIIALGTLFGGWRIVKTLGEKITKLNTVSGACAEGGAAATIIAGTLLGIPVATTHTVTGAITGVGAASVFARSKNYILTQITFAWLLTLPITAIMSYLLVKLL